MELNDRWQYVDNRLETTVQTKDFAGAVELMNQVAEVAEAHNHHPDIAIYGYNNVKISMTSHDAGTVTERDYNLAAAVDELFVRES